MISFDNLEFDLGNIQHGITKTVQVNIENSGSSIVNLVVSNSGCSCTTGSVDYSTMQPNSKAIFTIVFNTVKAGKGKQAKSIALNYTINKKSFSQIFRVKANVI